MLGVQGLSVLGLESCKVYIALRGLGFGSSVLGFYEFNRLSAHSALQVLGLRLRVP